ncbi:MAG: hypothetical protein ABI363_04125, partial [Nitrosospira sp.]
MPGHSARHAENAKASSLPDLKETGCKSVRLAYISPLFRPIEQLLAFKIVKIYPHSAAFSLRFFKFDRLLEQGGNGSQQARPCGNEQIEFLL